MLDAQHDVITVAEAAGFEPLGVVEAAKPIDYDISLILLDNLGCQDARPAHQLVELVEIGKRRNIRAHSDAD